MVKECGWMKLKNSTRWNMCQNLVVMVFDRVLRKDSNEKYATAARLKLFEDSWIFLPQEVQSPQDERVGYFSLRCDWRKCVCWSNQPGVRMPWRGLNNRTLLLKEKDKDLRWCNVEDQPDPKVSDLVAVKRFLSSYKIDFEIHTGWISSLGEHSDSLQCTKQLQDTVLKF